FLPPVRNVLPPSSPLASILVDLSVPTSNDLRTDIKGVAYVSQTAWLMNATIRDNILFGAKYDENRYREVVEACALVKDFEILEGGDLTEIGEKGINLSGGQKQRISLARAAYSTAAIVLLDDPLSAVDAPTAKHLFKYCILGFMKNRTRILVSHATSLVLPKSDYLVLLKKGIVVSQGSRESLAIEQEATGLPSTVLGEEAEQLLTSNGFTSKEEEEDLPIAIKGKGKEKIGYEGRNVTKLVKEEERAIGSVSLSVYKRYFEETGGIFTFFVVVAALILGQFAFLVSDWYYLISVLLFF
ncbi:hypothetical protein HK096_010171, partial [Nowakowskiella sp. JEL0078]